MLTTAGRRGRGGSTGAARNCSSLMNFSSRPSRRVRSRVVSSCSSSSELRSSSFSSSRAEMRGEAALETMDAARTGLGIPPPSSCASSSVMRCSSSWVCSFLRSREACAASEKVSAVVKRGGRTSIAHHARRLALLLLGGVALGRTLGAAGARPGALPGRVERRGRGARVRLGGPLRALVVGQRGAAH